MLGYELKKNWVNELSGCCIDCRFHKALKLPFSKKNNTTTTLNFLFSIQFSERLDDL